MKCYSLLKTLEMHPKCLRFFEKLNTPTRESFTVADWPIMHNFEDSQNLINGKFGFSPTYHVYKQSLALHVTIQR